MNGIFGGFSKRTRHASATKTAWRGGVGKLTNEKVRGSRLLVEAYKSRILLSLFYQKPVVFMKKTTIVFAVILSFKEHSIT